MQLPSQESCAKDPFLHMLWNSDRHQYFGSRGTNQMFIGHRRLDTSFKLMQKHLPPASKELRMADFACGVGTIGLQFAELGCSVDFIDNEDKYFDYIRLKKTTGEAGFIKADVSQYVGENKYSAIFLGEAIEHMARPDLMLKNLRENLVTGGVLCLTTPNGNYVDCQEPSWVQVKDQPERNERLANNIGNHVCEFLPTELAALVKEAGFVLLEHKLVISKQICRSSLARRLLPQPLLWALDDKLSTSRNAQSKDFGKIQIIVACRVH